MLNLLVLNKYEEQQFHSSTICHICKNPFTENDVKVRDHCHLSGNFKGSAHQECNLNYQISNSNIFIMEKYDFHLFIKEIRGI